MGRNLMIEAESSVVVLGGEIWYDDFIQGMKTGILGDRIVNYF